MFKTARFKENEFFMKILYMYAYIVHCTFSLYRHESINKARVVKVLFLEILLLERGWMGRWYIDVNYLSEPFSTKILR